MPLVTEAFVGLFAMTDIDERPAEAPEDLETDNVETKQKYMGSEHHQY